MLTFREFLKEQLKDAEFKKEYVALTPEFDEIRKQLRSENKKRIRKSEMQTYNDLNK